MLSIGVTKIHRTQTEKHTEHKIHTEIHTEIHRYKDAHRESNKGSLSYDASIPTVVMLHSGGRPLVKHDTHNRG